MPHNCNVNTLDEKAEMNVLWRNEYRDINQSVKDNSGSARLNGNKLAGDKY